MPVRDETDAQEPRGGRQDPAPGDLRALLAAPGSGDALAHDPAQDVYVAADGTSFDSTDGIPVLLPHEDLAALSETIEDEALWYDGAEEYADYVVQVSRDALAMTAKTVGESPDGIYIDALYEHSAQREAIQAVSPLTGKTVAQIGGSGLHSVKMLMSGAALAITVTPFLREAVIAKRLAAEFGYSERHLAVVGMGEALPLRDAAFDALYLGGSLHHLNAGPAAREMARVLRAGGAFVAVDPWRTAVYSTGTRIFGKRERDVSCIPMDPSRVAALEPPFASVTVTRYHPLLRYPLILLKRTPVKLSSSTISKLLETETRWESRLPAFARGHGSCVAIVGRKS